MNEVIRTWRTIGLLAVLAIAGCATEVYAPAATNPPPSEPFKDFGTFRLESVTLSPAFTEHGYNQSARASIDRSLQKSLGALLT